MKDNFIVYNPSNMVCNASTSKHAPRAQKWHDWTMLFCGQPKRLCMLAYKEYEQCVQINFFPFDLFA